MTYNDVGGAKEQLERLREAPSAIDQHSWPDSRAKCHRFGLRGRLRDSRSKFCANGHVARPPLGGLRRRSNHGWWP